MVCYFPLDLSIFPFLCWLLEFVFLAYLFFALPWFNIEFIAFCLSVFKKFVELYGCQTCDIILTLSESLTKVLKSFLTLGIFWWLDALKKDSFILSVLKHSSWLSYFNCKYFKVHCNNLSVNNLIHDTFLSRLTQDNECHPLIISVILEPLYSALLVTHKTQLYCKLVTPLC